MQKRIRLVACMLALVFCALCFVGCSDNEKVIGTCGTHNILYEELRFITLTYKDRLDATYGDGNDENGTIWDDPVTAAKYRQELEDAVWDMLRDNYKTLVACEAYFLDSDDLWSEAIQKAAAEQLQDTIAQYENRGAFLKDLESAHMTEHLFSFYLAVEELKYELYYVLTRDLQMVENSETNFYDWLLQDNVAYVQHIFIKNDKGDSIEANRAKAEEVRDALRSGERTLSDYINSTINEDYTNVYPYFLVRDVYVDELADAALATESIGDVSDVAEVDTGFYVFVRLDYTTEQLMAQIPTLFNTYQWVKISDIVNTYRDKVNIVLNDFGKSIDLMEIR